jgi:arylsulfatase A-like enzyme/tetratricopeptide (TPR) repeat protein
VRAWRHVAVFASIAAAAAAACSPPAGLALAPGSLRGANVLLVTIDTLRQDRIGAYGNPNQLTPTIDRLAAGGVRVAHAFTTAPLTLPAHASILTGLLPRRHGIHNNTSFRLDDRAPTLASALAGAGYRTGAFVGAFVLDARFGLNRGFGEYDDHLPRGDRASFHYAERRAADVVRLAGDWILRPSAGSAPWFAWVHLFDPHAPYDAPPEYRAGRAPYDAEVAYADAMLGALLARLQQARALDRTLVVVTADHGESLGEHGETTHGLFAYDATLAVPLVFSAPALPARTIDVPTSHVDLMPTILDLVGVDVGADLDGVSLARAPAADRVVQFEALDASITRGWAPLVGIVQRGWKYIDLPEPELYDLVSDPHEQRNLVDRDPHAEVLRRLIKTTAGAEGAAPRVALDAEAAGRLRSLGYAAGTAPKRPITAADDPKRLVALNERFNTALTAFDQGRSREALSALLDILRERSDFVAARTSAATVLVAEGDPRAAVRLLEEGLAGGEESPDLLARLGRARQAAGDLHGAAAALERARSAGDESPDIASDLAIVDAALGRADAARALFEALLARAPSSATTWYNLGLLDLQQKRPAEAAAAFRRATAIEPDYGDAWQALGASLAAADRRGAIDAWRKAERLLPRDYDLLFNLGMALADSDARAEAIPYLERFVREAPRDRYARDLPQVRDVLARLNRAVR